MDAEFIPSQNGAFFDTLKRNNKQIREDRAEAIAELAVDLTTEPFML